MKTIVAEKVMKEVSTCTKKLKVAEVIGLLVQTINSVEKEQHIQFKDDDINAIETYFSLTLLARVNKSKDYQKILDNCSIEIKECEA